jgi:hypothetical protein
MAAIITIRFCVPPGHEAGDYARLHGNGGSGAIDWDNPISNQIFDLFPKGAGIYGYGHAPWGHSRWGHAHSMGTAGWGHMPWGHFPWGHGTAVITAQYRATECGEYKFAFKCYDELGNAHEGTPDEVTVDVHIAPPAPTGLKKVSYDKATDFLILEAT